MKSACTFRIVYFICKDYSFNTTTAQEIDFANHKRHMNRRSLLAPTGFCVYHFRFILAWYSQVKKEDNSLYNHTSPPKGLGVTLTVLVPRYMCHYLWISKVDLVLGQTNQTNMNMIKQPTFFVPLLSAHHIMGQANIYTHLHVLTCSVLLCMGQLDWSSLALERELS